MKIKQIAKDNPDLSYGVIRGILRGLKDVKNGKIEKYKWNRECNKSRDAINRVSTN